MDKSIDLSTGGILLPRRIHFVKATRTFQPSLLKPAKDSTALISSASCPGCARAAGATKSFCQVERRCSGTAGRALANLGHTCFVNAVLHCLAYTPTLEQSLARHAKTCQAIGLCLTCTLHAHMQEVFAVGGLVYPRGVVGALKCVREMFGDGRQHDAHEFLRCLMGLIIDTNKEVVSMFEGWLRSTLVCKACNFAAVSTHPFFDLNLASSASVEHSLRNFCAVEHLTQHFTCRRCGSRTLGSKQLQITHLPPVLCLQLKRFRLADDSRSVHKLGKHIAFPETLDMRPYLAPDHLSQATSFHLYGVISHLGASASSGSYVCHVKDWYGNWHECQDGDSKLRLVGVDAVLKSPAYILFYTPNVSDIAAYTPALSSSSLASSPCTSSTSSISIPSLSPSPSSSASSTSIATSEPNPKDKQPRTKKPKLPAAPARDSIRLKASLTAPVVEAWEGQSANAGQRQHIIQGLQPAVYEKDEWDAALDAGHVKKVRQKKKRSTGNNPFQTQQAVLAHKKAKDKTHMLTNAQHD